MNKETGWTADALAQLRVLWAEGHSIAEIGRRMGVSKNAVVGKAHRLALPSRPSPIRSGGTGRTPRTRTPPRVRGPSLSPLQALGPVPAPIARPVPVPAPVAAPAPIPAERRAPVQHPATVFKPPDTRHPCCWPIGEPGTSSFRYCDAPAKPGKPYCPEHAAVAYVRPYAHSARRDGTSPGR